MGAVFAAEDMRKVEANDPEPMVAVKVLAPDFARHPVAFVALQRESRRAQALAHPNVATVYDFDRDGDLVFVRAQIWLDGGAYLSSSAAVVGNAGLMGIGPYVVPHVRMDCYGAYTNNPPCGAMRGFGAVQAAFGYESQMDRLAEAVGVIEGDPAKHAVYYEPTTGGRLLRADLDSGASQVVTENLPDGAFGWRIVDGRIWYLSDIEEKSAKLHEFDPASGNDRVLGTLDAIMRNLDFSVMPDRKRILIVPFGTEDTDVGMFRLTRGDPPTH
jgi:hypothetical protein